MLARGRYSLARLRSARAYQYSKNWLTASLISRSGASAIRRYSLKGGEGEDDVVPASQNKSWVPVENLSLQKVTRQALVHELTQVQMVTANKIVPWFLSQMPAAYFRQVPEEVRVQHLRAICALQDTGPTTNAILRAETPDGGRETTFIRSGNYTGQLREMLSQLPRDFGPLSSIKVFTSLDQSLVLDIFTAGADTPEARVSTPKDRENILDYAKDLMAGKFVGQKGHPERFEAYSEEAMNTYMDRCTRYHIQTSNPRRFCLLKGMYDKVSGTENCGVHVEEYTGDQAGPTTNPTGRRYWVSVIQTNVLPRIGLEKCLKLFGLYKIDTLRCHMDRVQDPGNGMVCLLRMLVQLPPDAPDCQWAELQQHLLRSKWLDDATIEMATKHPQTGVERAEILVALGHMLHGVLAKQNMWAFSKAAIHHKITHPRVVPYAIRVADLLVAKFDPDAQQRLSPDDVTKRAAELRDDIRKAVEDTTTVILLEKMIDAIEGTYRTNLYLPHRYSLAFRIDPRVMVAQGENRILPYGVFFVHGRRFNGFHVRFRDIARGGLRIVSPPAAEQIAIESARQFDEAYGLAFAQQLKNKDIPEGGSKAVVLVDICNVSFKSRDFAKRKAVKGFVDGLLDLITDTPETRENVVDLWGRKEYLYLGPDEQIIPQDINWIVQQAARRKYANPNTFMSSKPDAGINHKVYGVTSEGIAVFLAVGLRHLGLDITKDSFTIKLTGGTDGDVCSNMIKILARDYGSRAKVVGLSDGTGVVEDPAGLDMDELMRLVSASLPLSSFDAAKLSTTGRMATVETEDGIRLRNTMHNRVVADAFIPAGGRPNTIDATNYRQFLKPDGSPSARLIVEGANIFITPEARKKLFDESGVLIIKDSSANKAGVICSSFEIISSMLLTEQQFKDHKEVIVAEVLDKLRMFARLEAELLFREYGMQTGALPYFSERISNAINLARDAITEGLDGMKSEEYFEDLLPLVKDHLPEMVVKLGWEHVRERVPPQYIKNAFASCLGNRIVYAEGTSFLNDLPREKLASLCLRYIHEEREVNRLTKGLETGTLTSSDMDRLRFILTKGGPRALLFADSAALRIK